MRGRKAQTSTLAASHVSHDFQYQQKLVFNITCGAFLRTQRFEGIGSDDHASPESRRARLDCLWFQSVTVQALSTQTLALKPCKPFRQIEPNIILLYESNDQPLLELPNVHSSAQCSKALSSMCTCKCHCKVCRQTSRGFIQAILRHNEAAYVAG